MYDLGHESAFGMFNIIIFDPQYETQTIPYVFLLFFFFPLRIYLLSTFIGLLFFVFFLQLLILLLLLLYYRDTTLPALQSKGFNVMVAKNEGEFLDNIHNYDEAWFMSANFQPVNPKRVSIHPPITYIC